MKIVIEEKKRALDMRRKAEDSRVRVDPAQESPLRSHRKPVRKYPPDKDYRIWRDELL